MFEHLLFYYIDNEIHGTYKPMKAVTDCIADWEKTNFDNQLQIPVYIVNGSPNLAPQYKNHRHRIADITGTYIGNKGFGTNNFTVLDNSPNQKMPVAIAQINGNKVPLRTRLYGAIAHGAKGMGYWRDFTPNVKEVEALMPLIRQPHWTTWKVRADNDMIDIGTREYQNECYIIK